MSRSNRQFVVAASLVAACAAMPARAAAQQSTATPTPAPPATTRPPVSGQPAIAAPQGQAAPTAPSARRSATPQGFSVVLVLGDLQGTSATDDVPLAAKRALADMREFLPYKSYRLLDAAWLMCCGEQRPLSSSERRALTPNQPDMLRNPSSQILRGPEEQEYELRLSASRAENGRVFVRFNLIGSVSSPPATAASANAAANSERTLMRRIADLQDRAELTQKQILEVKKKVDVGTSAGAEIPKMEVELRSIQREIQDLQTRLETGTTTAGRSGGGVRGSSADRLARASTIDTSFTMDVGETVVVGTSRLKGGTKALIALLTAVAQRGTPSARE
jgi:hypothetical protein